MYSMHIIRHLKKQSSQYDIQDCKTTETLFPAHRYWHYHFIDSLFTIHSYRAGRAGEPYSSGNLQELLHHWNTVYHCTPTEKTTSPKGDYPYILTRITIKVSPKSMSWKTVVEITTSLKIMSRYTLTEFTVSLLHSSACFRRSHIGIDEDHISIHDECNEEKHDAAEDADAFQEVSVILSNSIFTSISNIILITLTL